MSTSAESSTTAQSAQILDFTAYRLRKLARARQLPQAARRFLWGWPAAGQLSVVSFPSPAAASSFRSQSV